MPVAKRTALWVSLALCVSLAPAACGGGGEETDEGAQSGDAAPPDGGDDAAATDAAVADAGSKPVPKPPLLSMISPAQGATLHGVVEVAAKVEAALSHLKITRVSFAVDDVVFDERVTAPWSVQWDSGTVAEGEHQISVTAHDSAGLSSVVSVSLTVDRSGPVLSFDKPPPNAHVNGDETAVEIVLSGADPAPEQVVFSVAKGDSILKLATLDKAPWSTTWSTKGRDSGVWTLIATGTDGNGLSSSALRHVVLDRPPTLEISKPAANATLKGVVEVKLSASDDLALSELRLELDGKPLAAKAATAKQETLTANWDTATTAGGEHTLSARCVDSAGAAAKVSIKVQVDQPMQAHLAVCEGEVFAKCAALPKSPLAVSGKVALSVVIVDDTAKPGSATLKIDGKPLIELKKAPLQWLWDTSAIADGLHQIALQAVNDAGEKVDLAYEVSVNNCDIDGDGHLSDKGTCGGDDCDDGQAAIYTGAKDMLGDGVDQSCDGFDGVDADGDGWIAESSGGDDCDDSKGAVHPCSDDVAGDGLDQNCDGKDEQACDDCEQCTLDAPSGSGCAHLAFDDGSLCKDDLPCTADESCKGGKCVAGKVVDCDDGEPCTADACDGSGGCVHDKLKDGATCGDGKSCKAGVCG